MKIKQRAINKIIEIRKYSRVRRNVCGSKSIQAQIEDTRIYTLMDFFEITEEEINKSS